MGDRARDINEAGPAPAPVAETERYADAPLLDVVIVVSAGAREHLRNCLQSLERHPLILGRMEVHVIDNASRDGTAEMARESFPWVDYEELDWNAGFTVANNRILARTRGEFALVLNPDTIFEDDSLDHMVRLMRERPEVGMAGCRLTQLDGTLDHAAKRSFPTPIAALAHFTGLGRRPGAGRRLAQYRAPHLDELDSGEVDAVNGAYMLVRRSAMEEVGLFDEGYWIYMEDLDWCYRFKQLGWKVWYEGAVTVIHVKSGVTGRKRPARQTLAFHRSMGRFYRKFYAGERPLVDAAVYLGILAKTAIALTRSAIARRGLG